VDIPHSEEDDTPEPEHNIQVVVPPHTAVLHTEGTPTDEDNEVPTEAHDDTADQDAGTDAWVGVHHTLAETTPIPPLRQSVHRVWGVPVVVVGRVESCGAVCWDLAAGCYRASCWGVVHRTCRDGGSNPLVDWVIRVVVLLVVVVVVVVAAVAAVVAVVAVVAMVVGMGHEGFSAEEMMS